MDVQYRLKELRAAAQLSQQAVADAVGLAKVVYQRYENGRLPQLPQLVALADFFDVSLDYLVGRSDFPERR